MNQSEFDEAARLHGLWLRDESGGLRADFRDADLCHKSFSDANLSRADFTDADLRGASLGGANFRGASLGGANFCGATLRGADFTNANLRGAILCHIRGAVVLGYTDHGYIVLAVEHQTEECGWRIFAGCRSFAIQEARAHWGSPDYHMPRSGSRCVAMLDWLESWDANEAKGEE